MLNIQNLDAVDLDILHESVETIEGADTEGILYMTQADFDDFDDFDAFNAFNAFNATGGGLLAEWDADLGHPVAFVIPELSTKMLLAGLATISLFTLRGRCFF